MTSYNSGLEHYLTLILHISSYHKLWNLIVFLELPLAVTKSWWDTLETNGHGKNLFSSLSPEDKNGLGTGSFHEKLSQPLLANILGIWSNSGLQFPFLSFCKGFAQPFLLCISSLHSKAQGPTRNHADLNQKHPGAMITAVLSNYLHWLFHHITPTTNTLQKPFSSPPILIFNL